MKKIRLAVIGGIRSHYMKLAAFQLAVRKFNAQNNSTCFDVTYINSGQHYDNELSRDFINELDVNIHYDFTGKYSNQDPIHILGQMIIILSGLLSKLENLDWVVVFGDANTTLAGAIASSKCGIPLIHIEAGLRTHDIKSPEEVNRVVADHLSSMLFVSSKNDLNNLMNEGLLQKSKWTGDLIADLVRELGPKVGDSLQGYEAGQYILASLHREENLIDTKVVRNAVTLLSNYRLPTVFLTHPRTHEILKSLDLTQIPNIDFRNTLCYRDLLSAIKGCSFLFTDSGAFQREAYYLGKRCLVRQDTPFWISLVEAGINRAIGREFEEMNDGITWIENITLMRPEYLAIDDLGDGSAGLNILNNIAIATYPISENL